MKLAPTEALRRAPPTYTLAQAHGERVPNVSSVVCTMMNTHVVSSAYNTNVSVQYSNPCGVSFAHGTIDSPLVRDTYASELRLLSNETRYLPPNTYVDTVVDVPNETRFLRGPPPPLIDPNICVSTAHENRFLRGPPPPLIDPNICVSTAHENRFLRGPPPPLPTFTKLHP